MVEAARRYYPFDARTVLVEDATLTATANLGPDTILDMGDGRIDGTLVLDITALNVADGDENYDIFLQGSNSPTFASLIENLAAVDFAPAAHRNGGANVPSIVGRAEVPFSNSMSGIEYRYLRVRIVIAGTTPSITLSAFVSTKPAG